MDSSLQVLDLAAGSWGYFLPCNCWSARLAGAAALAAFLFFGPMWVSSGKLLFDHNWKRKTKRKKNKHIHTKTPSPNPQIKFVRWVGTTKPRFLRQQPAWIQLGDPRADPMRATSSWGAMQGQDPSRARGATGIPQGEQAWPAKSPEQHQGLFSGCLRKLFPELNSTPSLNLRAPPRANIITSQVWALRRKRSICSGMIFSTGHSLKCHQKYLEGQSWFGSAISSEVRTPRCVCWGRGVTCTRRFVQ